MITLYLGFMCTEFILLQQYFYHKHFFTQTAFVGIPHKFKTPENEYWISQGSSEELEMFTANETGLENLSRIKVEMWTREKSESAATNIFISSSYWDELCLQQKPCFLLWSESQLDSSVSRKRQLSKRNFKRHLLNIIRWRKMVNST